MKYTPDIKLGFRHQLIGKPECPYLERWVLQFGKFAIRLHHWMGSDDQRHLHDHPWWFITLVLKGGYTDISAPEVFEPVENRYQAINYDYLHVGSIRIRGAYHTHTVKVNPGGCWTLLITGPKKRDWGFWVRGVWKRQRKYFKEHGHHPCED